MYERSFHLQTRTGPVPVLCAALKPSGPYPGTVLVYHGLKASKETQRKEIERLAAEGFLAVGVDGHGHGERAIPDLAAFMQGDTHANFLKLVRGMLDELPAILDSLQQLEETGPFAVTGISMGGYVAFGAPHRDRRIQAIVPILGSPDWGTEDSPHLQSYDHVEIFAWNAGRDVNVPPDAARNLMARVRGRYIEYPHSDHFMRPEDWHDGWEQTVQWLKRCLSG